ncbi:MAG: copper chaperone NosL [Phycisphaerales bacterium]|jgi:copper chaperone NosL
MKQGLIQSVLVVSALLWVPGCGGTAADGPPKLLLGDAVCDECGMIVSDERFATATVVEGPRGPEPRMFDDFNCQINYERAHAADVIVARWSHDYGTASWMPTEGAFFLRSPGLRAPMGSGVAAFATESDAQAALRAAEHAETGEVLTFSAMRDALAPPG